MYTGPDKVVNTYKNFPAELPPGQLNDSGHYKSAKYGFKMNIVDGYYLSYKGPLPSPFLGIADNPQFGADCFELKKNTLLAEPNVVIADLCVSVNPFGLTPEEWHKEQITTKSDIEILGTNNKFVFDFQFDTYLKRREVFGKIQEEVRNNIVSTFELFDLHWDTHQG